MPWAQDEHMEAPKVGVNFPTSQFKQAAEELEPIKLLKVPGEHEMQIL